MSQPSLASLFTTADKILLLLSISLVVFSYQHFWQSTAATYALIKSPQQDTLTIDLSQAKTHHVQGLLGISTLQVEKGQIRFTSSACKNKICIQSGWHQHSGSITACLPNRIVVQLASHDATKKYDAIIF